MLLQKHLRAVLSFHGGLHGENVLQLKPDLWSSGSYSLVCFQLVFLFFLFVHLFFQGKMLMWFFFFSAEIIWILKCDWLFLPWTFLWIFNSSFYDFFECFSLWVFLDSSEVVGTVMCCIDALCCHSSSGLSPFIVTCVNASNETADMRIWAKIWP